MLRLRKWILQDLFSHRLKVIQVFSPRSQVLLGSVALEVLLPPYYTFRSHRIQKRARRDVPPTVIILYLWLVFEWLELRIVEAPGFSLLCYYNLLFTNWFFFFRLTTFFFTAGTTGLRVILRLVRFTAGAGSSIIFCCTAGGTTFITVTGTAGAGGS